MFQENMYPKFLGKSTGLIPQPDNCMLTGFCGKLKR